MHKKPYSCSGSGKRAFLIRARLSSGFTQTDVARELGCSRELYSQIENGIRDGIGMSIPEKLEVFFGLPQTDLMAISEDHEIFTEVK